MGFSKSLHILNVKHPTLIPITLLVGFCCNIAQAASPKIASTYLEREVIFILTASLALGLFYALRGNKAVNRFRPIGRRVSDLSTLNHESKYKKIDNFSNNKINEWEAVKIEKYLTHTINDEVIWNINAFSCHLLNGKLNNNEKNHEWYHFATNGEEAEAIIYPILRKIYARYRNQFELAAPVSIIYAETSERAVTWLPSEQAIRSCLFHFLDECLIISDICQCEPVLTICHSTCFWVLVTWPNINDINWIQRTCSEHPELELVDNNGIFGLRLHLSFTLEAMQHTA